MFPWLQTVETAVGVAPSVLKLIEGILTELQQVQNAVPHSVVPALTNLQTQLKQAAPALAKAVESNPAAPKPAATKKPVTEETE